MEERVKPSEGDKLKERAIMDDRHIHFERVNTVTFTLPALPNSVNNIYQILWHQRKVELKPECRQWKSKAKEYVPLFKVGEGSLVRVDLIFYYDFFYKNGKLREFDTHNLIKLVNDAIAERLGGSDKTFKRGSWDSVNDRKERVIVTLTEYALQRTS